jgi:ribosomal protein S18 acetylase RimI-like enzyme
MRVLDWRHVPADLLRPVYQRERQLWLTRLCWDPADALGEVEQARSGWGLPGLVALDGDGRAHGSVFYMESGRRVDIGGISAEDAGQTCLLLNGVLDAAERAHAAEVACFAYAGAPALALELQRRDFEVEPFLYLTRSLEGPVAPSPESNVAGVQMRTWRPSDAATAGALLARAYDRWHARVFAPEQTAAAWEQYLRALVDHTACGVLNADASAVVVNADGALVGLAIVTAVAASTAHLAQLAVDPSLAGRGLATQLVAHAAAAASAQQFSILSLLVAGRNARARALYERLGFVERGTFVSAFRQLPRAA